MSSDNPTLDPTRVREAVARARRFAEAFGFQEDIAEGLRLIDAVELCAAAALDSLTQRDKVQELSRAAAQLRSELEAARTAPTIQVLSDGIDEAVALERARWEAEVAGLRGELEAARAERDALEVRRASIADNLRLAKLDLTARLHTICSELGGLVEGFPTASHNYLQRIRELRQIEAQLSTAQADAQGLREALRPLAALSYGYERAEIDVAVAWDSEDRLSISLYQARAARAALGAGGEEDQKK